MNQKTNRERAVQAFLAAIICYSVATGLSSSIYTNYFKEAYQADSFLRGLIEIPRESPGILTLLLISGLGFLGNVELAVIAHALITVGLVVMGFLSPSLGVMMVFLFINSLGTHMLLTLNDAIAISLAEKGKTGTMLGKVKGISTFCSLLIAVVVFFGFRLGWFSFTTPVILPFAIAAVVSLGAVTAMLRMKRLHPDGGTAKKFHLLLRKEYIPYYCITFAYGCQKRIRLVFGPWVIAELLYMGADTLALLAIATHFIGTAFGPWIGRMLDKWGVRKMLLIEAGYIAVTAGMLGIAAQRLLRRLAHDFYLRGLCAVQPPGALQYGSLLPDALPGAGSLGGHREPLRRPCGRPYCGDCHLPGLRLCLAELGPRLCLLYRGPLLPVPDGGVPLAAGQKSGYGDVKKLTSNFPLQTD